MTVTRSRVILDGDPGVDDAVAWVLAMALRERLEILGLSTVAGNVSAELTARNACVIREIAGAPELPVFRGESRPLVREPIEAGHFHGESGLGDLAFTPPRGTIEEPSSVEFLIRTLEAAEAASITLVITGPATNLARALTGRPTLTRALRAIAWMGGARSEGGNITASAEYNLFADPHAAQVILRAGVPLYVFGLDLTHQVRSTPERIARIRSIDSPAARAVATWLEFSSGLPGNGPRTQGAPLHDPCPVAWLVAPHLFEFRPASIHVECDSPLTLGHSAVEFRVGPQRPANAQWAVRADADGFFALLEAALRDACDAASQSASAKATR